MPPKDDLFGDSPSPRKAKADERATNHGNSYSAADIEVLEGLEPVRRRPGMYIGGTDVNALHHLFAEVIDNSMDEAIGGHASRIEVHFGADGYVTVTDNGRGIPVENHPKFPKQSTLEIVMTTLHAGGKFDSKAYETSGGLHGVGVSVVNALSDELITEVARNGVLYRQSYSRGKPTSKVIEVGIDKVKEDSVLQSQLAAGIQSTGNAANVSVDGMNALAKSISLMSGQTDDSIAKTESLLLTFTNIKNQGPDKIFDQATQAAADMAARMQGEGGAEAKLLFQRRGARAFATEAEAKTRGAWVRKASAESSK